MRILIALFALPLFVSAQAGFPVPPANGTGIPARQIVCPGVASGIVTIPVALDPATVLPAVTLTCIVLDPAVFKVDSSVVPSVLRISVGSAVLPSFVDDEVPSGVMDGVNKTFRLLFLPTTGSLKLYFNGLRMKPGLDYSIAGNAITFLTPVFPADPKLDVLTADYRH